MKFVVYRDDADEYRWRCLADDGRVLAQSGEGYRRKIDCLAYIGRLKEDAPWAPVEEHTAAA